MHRIVHLDLKGAPLKVPFLERIILCAKQWGATGILLEWEDTFPYSAELVDIGSQMNSGGDGMYRIEEVRHILRFIKDNGLEPIQLVQTIGHLEFVLKHPAFHSLRESASSPAVLCPSKPESLPLVRTMLKQILEVQPDAQYLHIGADEVWHTAICAQCQKRAVSSQHKTPSLFLDHVRNLTNFLKQKRPKLTVLMWDDMLRSVSLDTLRAYQLAEVIQPVIWHYNTKECFQIDPNLWELYRQLFPKVWAGSAFKGANGSCQMLSPVQRYVSNNEAWVDEIKKFVISIDFAGVILTGWSRYDHYATLCELLPVSLPSLACCLKTLKDAEEAVVNESLPSDQWPGERLARCVHSLVILRERCFSFINGDLVSTWMNPWQLRTKYTNPVQVESVAINAKQLLSELTALQKEFSLQLHSLTGRRSAEEWMETFIWPVLKSLSKLCTAAESRCHYGASIRPI